MKILLIQETDNNQNILAKAIFCLLITMSISFIIMYFKVDKEKSELEARYFSIYEKPGEYHSVLDIPNRAAMVSSKEVTLMIHFVEYSRDSFCIQTKFINTQNEDMGIFMSDEMSLNCCQNLKTYFDNKFENKFKIVNHWEQHLISDRINFNNKYVFFSPAFSTENLKRTNTTITLGECEFKSEEYSLRNVKGLSWLSIRGDFYFFTIILFIIPLIYYIFSYFRNNYLLKRK